MTTATRKDETMSGMYRVKNTRLYLVKEGDCWRVPSYAGDFLVRVASDGAACHPMTDGPASEQLDHNVYCVERIDEPILGWGGHDCEYHYTINGFPVAAHVAEQLARITGLAIPCPSAS